MVIVYGAHWNKRLSVNELEENADEDIHNFAKDSEGRQGKLVNDDNVNSTNDVKINKEQQDEINEMREDLGKRIKRKPIWHNDYDMSNLAVIALNAQAYVEDLPLL
ncbi:hypothetical protein QE152_g37506 [Popillia japonica]|uniref:Uncharacterized protein n=1 Tax=Popillia japonica TaxID=7064 RepID=A0AAW1IA81_POPJA